MKRAAFALTSVAFVWLLVQLSCLVLGMALSLGVSIFGQSADQGPGIVVSVILGIFSVLTLIGFILLIAGRTNILNQGKKGPSLILAAGIIGVCPAAIIAGAFFIKTRDEPMEKEE